MHWNAQALAHVQKEGFCLNSLNSSFSLSLSLSVSFVLSLSFVPSLLSLSLPRGNLAPSGHRHTDRNHKSQSSKFIFIFLSVTPLL